MARQLRIVDVAAEVIGWENARELGRERARGLREAVRLLKSGSFGPDPLVWSAPRKPNGEPRVFGRAARATGLLRWETDEDGSRWPVIGADAPDEVRAGAGSTRGPRCPTRYTGRSRGQPWCYHAAGWGTEHPGVGRCKIHGGNKTRQRAEAGWLVGHAFAGEMECSPWEGLLRAVRIAARKVAYTEWVISQAADDLELEGRFGRDESGLLVHPDTGEPLGGGQLRNRSWWVQKNELWVERMARYSKLAIDAGVAERLVQQVEVEGQQLGRVLAAVLGELEGQVPEEVVSQARAAMRRELLAIEVETSSSQVARTSDADARVVDSTYVTDDGS